MKKRVVHIITGLAKGGAETMLVNTLRFGDRDAFAFEVVSLSTGGYYRKALEELGVPVHEIAARRNPLGAIWRLRRILRGADTVCCWMYHACLAGSVAARLAGVRRVVWSIHHSNLDPALNKKSTLRVVRQLRRMSRSAAAIAYSGDAARMSHEAFGFCADHSAAIPNGCDIRHYRKIPGARERLGEQLGLTTGARIVLSAARDDPQKDVPGFLKAFALLHERMPDTVAVLCGSGISPENAALLQCAQALGLAAGKNAFFLGRRDDMPALFSACSLYVLHSAGEAFPVTLIEAMACEALCVATDVGDARQILPQPHLIVPPGAPDRLAKVALETLALGSGEAARIGAENRETVAQRYAIEAVAGRYESLY